MAVSAVKQALLMSALLAALALPLAACDDGDSTAEQVGEAVEDSGEAAGEAIEETGEAIEDTAEDAEDSAQDLAE